MADRWIIFILLQFVSATLGFGFYFFIDHSTIFVMVALFFFTLGTFGATRWGFDKWKSKNKPRKREKKR